MIGKKESDLYGCQKSKTTVRHFITECELHDSCRENLKIDNRKWPQDNLFYLTKNEQIGLRQIEEFVKLTNRFT